MSWLRPVLVVVALAALPACGGASREELSGTWALDAEATRELPDVRNMPQAERAEFQKGLKDMSLKMTFVQNTVKIERGLMVDGEPYEQAEKGTFRVVSSDGNHLVLAMTNSEGDKKRLGVAVKGDRLTLEMEGSHLVLRRK